MNFKNIYKKISPKLISSKKLILGFTLIETMVAITILLMAIAGPMEIASKSLLSAYYARDQITAYYLAQEGIEYLRNDRDNYYLQNPNVTNWPADFSSCVNTDPNHIGCEIGANSTINTAYSVMSCGSTCAPLNYASDLGFYSYAPTNGTTNLQSKYTRVVTVSPDPSGTPTPDSVLVTSTVYWSGVYLPGTTKSFTIKEVLYNWPIQPIQR